MLSKARIALHQAVEEVVKELDNSYEETKRYNESLRNNNCFLMKRIKELYDQCKALQAKKDCSAVQEENARLLSCIDQQKSENEVLHRKVNDLGHKYRQACRERDELAQIRDRLESCPVSGEVTLKLKGVYHTFFKARIKHPNYSEDNMKDCSENPQAPIKDETPDGKEPTSKSTGTGYNFYYKNPVTGEMVGVKPLTKYEVLELKYNDMREDNIRLLRRVASQKTENELLQCKVHNLSCELSQAYRERDKFKDKLRELRQLIDEVCQ